MNEGKQRDWDDAFDNMGHVAGSSELPARWSKAAEAYRESGIKIEADIPYGSHERERMDIVWPDKEPRGLAVFVHGGYWIKLDKSFWTHLAEGARANGWAVVIPSYTLAPEVRVSEITKQISNAVSLAAEKVRGPIHLAGHSAGGHLVSRMMCEESPLDVPVLKRLEAVLSISGLHDLRPLMWTKMNEILRLDEEEAHLESVALHRPIAELPLTCWVGGGELPEFVRQAKLLAMMWDGLNAQTNLVIDGQHNHFTVIEALSDPNSGITKAFIG